MSGPHHEPPEVDPVTGYETTGHDWNGIKELNTPFPKIVIWALVLTFLYAVITWVLLPAWPIGKDYTRGLLGLSQEQQALEGLQDLDAKRSDWMTQFDTEDVAQLRDDAPLMALAMPAANRLFLDNCAACHGTEGGGGPGFPALNDATWLWSSDPEIIAETLRVGINAPHEDTRVAEMPAFDWMESDELTALADLVSTLPAGAMNPNSPATLLFEENCSACHGETGEGGLENGAPSLTDAAVIYGQDPHTVLQTLRNGRRGVMPSWSDRLSNAEINLLALYVVELAQEAPQ
ncbi:cytochrome-c oxidase, cbb3-type subunit III [Falsihalocynthiibacter sp. S25ZX9]|uniref:cytochrome-c oxidase, cbb3-type subunit III n=1 Tax=Falsihalocynthiibacter sp. S25ZX9 TaxID=3240870 RepID=UPI00350FF7FA